MVRKMAALLLGNSDYPGDDYLKNPINDVDDLAAKLKGYGFTVTIGVDCSFKEMDKKLKIFRKLLEVHEVGLFFFAGHGIQIDGSNYLLAIDTDMETDTDAKHSSLNLDKVVEVMATSAASTKIIMLDACRNNPFKRKWQRDMGQRGLASVYAPKGTIIGFATSPGEFAGDGEGRNGTYTSALLNHIDAPDCTIETMFKRVRNTVAASTDGKQTSWEHTSLSGEFYFNLSLGNMIEEYHNTALADRLFVLDEGKKSHRIIMGLKTLNWYLQNPALDQLDKKVAKAMGKNNAFVLGRNIYQAACGNAGSACMFIDDFEQTTSQYPPEKRKALLDGMLIEIFFNSDGEFRERIKSQQFSQVFSLQRHPKFKDSFNFIAETLISAGSAFYAVPGKGHELAVTVNINVENNEATVASIYVDGSDVLRIQEDSWDFEDGKRHYTRMNLQRFEDRIISETMVPEDKLKLSFTPALPAAIKSFYLPTGWTIKKL